MGLLDRLRETLSGADRGDRSDGVEYQCSACGAAFGSAHATCPRCGAADVLERSTVEFAPNDERTAAAGE